MLPTTKKDWLTLQQTMRLLGYDSRQAFWYAMRAGHLGERLKPEGSTTSRRFFRLRVEDMACLLGRHRAMAAFAYRREYNASLTDLPESSAWDTTCPKCGGWAVRDPGKDIAAVSPLAGVNAPIVSGIWRTPRAWCPRCGVNDVPKATLPRLSGEAVADNKAAQQYVTQFMQVYSNQRARFTDNPAWPALRGERLRLNAFYVGYLRTDREFVFCYNARADRGWLACEEQTPARLWGPACVAADMPVRLPNHPGGFNVVGEGVGAWLLACWQEAQNVRRHFLVDMKPAGGPARVQANGPASASDQPDEPAVPAEEAEQPL